jgi:hypothetical protein
VDARRLRVKRGKLFGLVTARSPAHHICLSRTSVGNNSINLVFVRGSKLPFDSKDLDIDRIREHCHVPNNSSGLQIVGGMYPDSSSLKLFPHKQAAKAAMTSAMHPAFRRQPCMKSLILVSIVLASIPVDPL